MKAMEGFPSKTQGRAIGLVMALLVFFPGCSGGDPAPAQEETPARPAETGPLETQYSLPGGGILVLGVPEGWAPKVERPETHPLLLIRFTPAEADASVLVSITGITDDGSPVDAARLRTIVAQLIDTVRNHSAEQDFPVTEFQGRACSGIYYKATNKKPQLEPGEYRHFTQGMAAAGALELSFTVLSNDDTHAIRNAAVTMIKTARFQPAP